MSALLHILHLGGPTGWADAAWFLTLTASAAGIWWATQHAWWWLHGGPDAFETLPEGGWLDERAEVWHG